MMNERPKTSAEYKERDKEFKQRAKSYRVLWDKQIVKGKKVQGLTYIRAIYGPLT